MGGDPAIVGGGRRLVGREDSEDWMNVNERGGDGVLCSSPLAKRSRTRGVTSVDNGC